MKSTRLLLKNAFRSAAKVKIQIIGLSLLIMFMAIIFSIISTTNTQVVSKKDNLNRRSNLRHSLVDAKGLGQVTLSKDQNINDNIQNQELFYQYLVNFVSDSKDLNFIWTRTEARSFSKMKSNGEEVNMKVLVKTGKDDEKPAVDSLIIEEGRDIKYESDIVINKEFAFKNDIKIGDVIRIEKDIYGDTLKISEGLLYVSEPKKEQIEEFLKKEKENKLDQLDKSTDLRNMAWFKVIGFGLSADFISPIIDETTFLPDTKLNFIGYVHHDNFGLEKHNKENSAFNGLYKLNISNSRLYGSDYGRETYFSIKYDEYKKENTEILNTEILNKLENKKQNKFIYDVDDTSYKFANRILMLNNVVKAYIITSNILLISTALISSFVLALILKKQVTDMQSQIGCLKSLGYRKRELLNNFIAVPLISSFIGTVVGYLVSLGFGPVVIGIFQKFFNLSYGNVTFSWLSLLITFLIFWSFVTTITLIFTILLIKKNTLQLLSGTVDKKISILSRIFKKIFSGKSFSSKLRASLLVSSSRKFVATIFIFLMSSILLSLSISSLFIVKENQKKTFAGLNYNYVAEYNSVVTDNPQTLLKYYNPEISSKQDPKDPTRSWGFQKDKKIVGKNLLSPNSGAKNDKPKIVEETTETAYTSYPVIKENEKTYKYNTDFIYDQLISKNIPAQYYELNFLEGKNNASQWSRLSNLNYTNLSFNLLKAIDDYASDDVGLLDSIALYFMIGQWLDFVKYQEEIKNVAKKNNDNEKKLSWLVSKILINFFDKYNSGLPLSFKKKFFEKQFFNIDDKKEVLKKDLKEEYKKGKEEKFSLISPVAEKVSYLINMKDKIDEYNNYIKKISEQKITSPKEFPFYNKKDKLEEIEISKINFDDIDDEYNKNIDFKFLNTQFGIWFNTIFWKRLSLIVLQTSYSRAPYYVQQKMKRAYENGERYEMMFNTIPYIPNKDILGTMVKAELNNCEFNIYGVPKNINEFINFNGEDPKIFSKSINSNEIPIIVNKSFLRKFGLKKDLTFDSTIFAKKTSINNESDDLKFRFGRFKDGKVDDINSRLFNYNFVEMGANTYYSIDNKNYSTETEELTGKIKPTYIEVNKEKINLVKNDPNGAKDSPSDIHKKYLKGEASIKEQEKNQTFKIVAIQDSFGKPQGWIDQDIANEILGLNKLRDKVFLEWFLPDILLNKDFEQFITNKTHNKNTIDIDQIREYMFSLYYQQRLQKVDELLNKDLKSPYFFKIISDLFESTYPIFNFKYSKSLTIHEIESQISISQEFGDYSSIGLNGGNISDSANYNDNDDGTYRSYYNRVDKNKDEKFVDGAAITTVKTAIPTFEAQKILAQLTTIVNLIMMMFTVLASAISLIIILLVTSIIIHEKKSFIAIMKLLGYSSFYIVKQIVSIYLWVLLATIIVGFIISYYSIGYATLVLAQNTQWILPFQFNYLVPIILFITMFSIYLITTGISLTQVRKINPVIVTGFSK